jgi:hypothetical protein
MSRAKQTTLAALVMVSLAGLVSAEDKRIADADVAAWVTQRVQDWQPTREERRFDEIGWVTDIREALRLAKEHNRPVFLFTHDGRMAIGRC